MPQCKTSEFRPFKQARELLGRSQAAFARDLGEGKSILSSIQAWEQGTRGVPEDIAEIVAQKGGFLTACLLSKDIEPCLMFDGSVATPDAVKAWQALHPSQEELKSIAERAGRLIQNLILCNNSRENSAYRKILADITRMIKRYGVDDCGPESIKTIECRWNELEARNPELWSLIVNHPEAQNLVKSLSPVISPPEREEISSAASDSSADQSAKSPKVSVTWISRDTNWPLLSRISDERGESIDAYSKANHDEIKITTPSEVIKINCRNFHSFSKTTLPKSTTSGESESQAAALPQADGIQKVELRDKA